jgi:hypothetical protein
VKTGYSFSGNSGSRDIHQARADAMPQGRADQFRNADVRYNPAAHARFLRDLHRYEKPPVSMRERKKVKVTP